MIRRAALALAAWLSAATLAWAETPVLVELYTSQGCSSCPPADAILGEIADRDDVIALALHVDYWDYIGWKDDFASPAFSDRQRKYSRAAGKRSVYTPQMIVQGTDFIVGTKPMKLVESIDRHKAAPEQVDLRLTREGDRVSIRASSVRGAVGRAVVRLATYTPEATRNIARGENAGRTLVYHNIVRNLVDVGDWDGRGSFRAAVRVSEDTPVVVLIQQDSYGPVLAVGRLR